MLMNRTIKRAILIIVTALLAIPVISLASVDAEKPLLLELASSTIKISTFYNGTTLEITGSVPVDTDVVLQISGPRHEVHLKEKGKVAGFLWMNKNDVTLENTPAVYMIYTPPGPREKYLNPELGLGYKALINDITISPESADKAFIFDEYVKLMEKSGVYAIKEGAITYGEANDGMKSFTTTLDIPSKMSAGKYTVEATAVKGGIVAEKSQKELTLELSGFPALIASMANDRPLLFGFMAVFIAIAAGLLIGVIFRGGGGAH